MLYKTLSYQTGGRQTLLLALKKLQCFEMARDCGWPLDAKSGFRLTATKKMGTSVLQSQGDREMDIFLIQASDVTIAPL